MGSAKIPNFSEEYEEAVACLKPMLALIRRDLHHQQMMQPGIEKNLFLIKL